MEFKLPLDYARCMSETCGVKESCLRWQQRNTPGAQVFISPDPSADGCDELIDDGTGPLSKELRKQRELDGNG